MIYSRSSYIRYLEVALNCFSINHLARELAIGGLVEKRASSSWKLRIDVAHFAVTHRDAGRMVVHIYAFRNLTQISNEITRRIRTVTDAGLICQMKRNGGRQPRDLRSDSHAMTRANDFAWTMRTKAALPTRKLRFSRQYGSNNL